MTFLQPDRMSGNVAPAYVRDKPEQTLLYQLVEKYWPEFQTQPSETGRFLPRHVRLAGCQPVLQTVCGQVIAADSLMKIARLSEFLCGGLMVVGGFYVLYSPW